MMGWQNNQMSILCQIVSFFYVYRTILCGLYDKYSNSHT